MFLAGAGGCSEGKQQEEGPKFADPAKNNQPAKRFQRGAAPAPQGAPVRNKERKIE
jgi:hypothetical protein